MTGNAHLLDRLERADPDDWEVLALLEPRYGTRDFLMFAFQEIHQRPSLEPLAFVLARFAADHDPAFLEPYTRWALMVVDQLSGTGKGEAALDVLAALERCARKHGDWIGIVNAKLNRLQILAKATEPRAVLHEADGLIRAMREVPRPVPPDAQGAVEETLAMAATRAYYEVGDLEATVRFGEAANQVTSSHNGLLLAGLAHWTLGRFELALEHFRALSARHPNRAYIEYNRACLEFIAGDSQEGEAAMERAIELKPDELLYPLSWALHLASGERVDDAASLFRSALPLCHAALRDTPDRTITMTTVGQVTIPSAMSLLRLTIANAAVKLGKSDLVLRMTDPLVDGDGLEAAMAHLARADLALHKGRPDAALTELDAAVECAEDAPTPRLRRAEILVSEGRFSEAIEDLGTVVHHDHGTNTQATSLLRTLVAAMPTPATSADALAAAKWLGCALAFRFDEGFEEGCALLDRVLELDPTDAYARLRRALARITVRDDRSLDEQFSSKDLFVALTEAGIAAEDGPGNAEIQHAWRWLVDRVSRDNRVLQWLHFVGHERGGIFRTIPGVARATTLELEAGDLAISKRHREAVALLENAQQELRVAGLPAYATRLNLHIADNLLRLDELQLAVDHIARYDASYEELHYFPLSQDLQQRAAEHRARVGSSVGLVSAPELELHNIYDIGKAFWAIYRAALIAQARQRTGHLEEAVKSAEAIATLVLAAAPRHEYMGTALGIVPLLRDGGKLALARELLDHLTPNVPDDQRPGFDFTLATVLDRENRTSEALALYERLQTENPENAGLARRAASNIARLTLRQQQPAKTLSVLSVWLGDPNLGPRDSLIVTALAAAASQKLGDVSKAQDLAHEALRHIETMRAGMATYEDRVAIAGLYEGLAADVLGILVASGDAPAVLKTVEVTRARTLVEGLDEREVVKDDALLEAEGRSQRIARILMALGDLQRGLNWLGRDYVDPNAFAVLAKEQPHRSLFEDEPHGGRLSVEKIREALAFSKDQFRRERVQVQRLRNQQRAYRQESSASEIHDALRRASTTGPRCVFVAVVPVAEETALVFVDGDSDRARLRRAPVAAASLALEDTSVLGSIERPELVEALHKLVEPILEETHPGDVVSLSLTGPLTRVPFHALAVNGQPWCARNPIAYTPSGTLLVHCLKQPPPRGESVVVGDPLGDLPKARDEARVVAAILSTDPLLGRDATARAVNDRLKDGRTAHAHFACHATFNSDDGMQSALHLARHGTLDNGILTAEELAYANLDGARVVLSACDAGLGEQRTESESFGLSRAILAAGARSVTVSLWAAEDTATYMLMGEFYRRLHQQGAARALAGAQLWLRDRTAAQLVASCDELLESEALPVMRARLYLERAFAQREARDVPAAKETLTRMVRENLAPIETARANRLLGELIRSERTQRAADYTCRPFSSTRDWAPFVVIGDWR